MGLRKTNNIDLDEEDPNKRPTWWHNTIGDVRVGEMIKGRSLGNKRKQKPNTINFFLMAIVQEVLMLLEQN